MSGFVRRYSYSPGIETITIIEGVIIVDLPPPGAIQGISNGTVACVGEFPDMTYATSVDSSGVVTTRARAVEVFSGQDMIDKVGGFDSTIGDHGNSGGNGFISLRNKKFTKLVIAPVNLASAGAGRCWRELPTNAADASPVVTIQGGRVEAGREFKSGVNRVKLGKRVVFTALGHFKNATDGVVSAAGAAVTQTMTSASGAFLTAYNGGPVKKGMIVVLGTIGGAGALGANAFTYRVTADAASNTSLTLEKLDGSSWTWTSGTALPYRIHPQTDADSGGTNGVNAQLSDPAGYQLPCRPIDATIALATACAPTVVPAVATASSWDALSGLTLRSHVASGFVYTATVQAPNAVYDAAIGTLYETALDGLLTEEEPARSVNIVFSSRTSTTIRSKLKTHELNASAVGIGRIACISPDLQTLTVAEATGAADPGVGATRDESVIYCWPGARTSVPEAVGITINTADSLTTVDGILDTPGDAWMAAVLSNLPPENNPGQAGAPVTEVLSPIIGLQRGLPNMNMSVYASLRANGIAGLRIDRAVGPIFQSGITSSLTSGQKNIARRRMANFIQDSVANRLLSFVKKPLTQDLKDTVTGEIDAFLNILKSPQNPATQRIVDYSVDDKSGNTPDTEAQGIYVVIGKVRTLASADFIVFTTEIGEGVVVSTTA